VIKIGTFVLTVFVKKILIVNMLKNFHTELIYGPITLNERHFANSVIILTILSFQCTESHDENVKL